MNTTQDDRSRYAVRQRDDGFAVVSPAGDVVLATRDEPSAAHYAELLTRAWRSGYRAGFRTARRETD